MKTLLLDTNIVSFLHHEIQLVTHNPKDFEAIQELDIITTINTTTD